MIRVLSLSWDPCNRFVINFTGGAVSASVDGTQTNVTIEALATEVFEDGVAIGTSIFDIELVQDSDNSTILASN